MRSMIRSCWPSFSPNTAMSAWTMLNSLATTVQTPRKCPGRDAPHKPRDSFSSTTATLLSDGYMSAADG